MKAKVTLTIDPDLWYQFRIEALARRQSGSAVLENLMRAQLLKWAEEKK